MDLDASLRALEKDRQSGSASLARDALDLLARAAGHSAASLALPALVRRLSLTRPVLAAVGVQSRRWLEELCLGLDLEPEALLGGRPLPGLDTSLVKRAGEAARALQLQELAAAAVARRAAFATLVRPGMVLLGFSASSQVEDLLRAAPAGSRLLLAESLPGGEGRALAALLRQDGLDARAIHDSELARAAAEADLALLGVDAVVRPPVLRRAAAGPTSPAGPESGLSAADLWGVNKVGSLLVLQVARAAGLPLLLALGREKCSGDPTSPFIRGTSWDRRAFEPFPLGGVRHVLADDGVVGAAWLAQALHEDQRRWHLFMN